MKIMFICTGNICRSAMAHWLMKKKLEDKNIQNIEVFSSGIYAMQGDIPTQEATEVMEEYGVDLKKHRATPTYKSNIEEMDLILCMTSSHRQNLISTYPNLADKIYTLKEYVGIDEIDIKDPWGYGLAVYRYCAAEIDQCLDKLIEKIKSSSKS
ncbi:MAG: low molecular weight protein arginine phosphatase [Clostridia bacterium]|nr:low molecular weight protein arginine phosphatase [Clostridia bacterium]